MRQKPRPEKEPAETAVNEIRRATRKHYFAEEKIRIVLEGIPPNVYYRWSKDCLEAGKKRLAGDTAREETSDEVRACARKLPPTASDADRLICLR